MPDATSALLSAVPGAQFLGPLMSLFGGISNVQEVGRTRADINNMAEFNPMNFGGPGGMARFNGGTGSFQLGPELQAAQSLMGMQAPALLAGGMFNSPFLQDALNQNNIAGALGQANSALGTQASPFFNQQGFQNIGNSVSNLGNFFSGAATQGPTDLSGGLQSNLFARGSANQAAASDQSGLFNQALGTMRTAAQPAQNQLLNRVQDRLFAQGRLGSTGGAQEMESLFNSFGQQDLGFQQAAFGQANQQQNFLAGLGSDQIGAATNLFGQNLNQYNQNVGNAQGFLGMGAGLEGQGFQQMLQALGQNQSAGLQRLQAAQGLFGLGNDVFNQQFTLGLGAQEGLLNSGRFGLENVLGLGNLEANRIGATGQHARSLAEVQQSSGGLLGNLLGGLGGLFG